MPRQDGYMKHVLTAVIAGSLSLASGGIILFARAETPAPDAGTEAGTTPSGKTAAAATPTPDNVLVAAELGEATRKAVLTLAPKDIDPNTTQFMPVTQGTQIDASVNDQRYQGTVYQSFFIYFGDQKQASVRSLYVTLSAPWTLAGGTVVPAGTCITLANGAYRTWAPGVREVQQARQKALGTSAEIFKSCSAKVNEWQAAQMKELDAKKYGPQIATEAITVQAQQNNIAALLKERDKEPDKFDVRQTVRFRRDGKYMTETKPPGRQRLAEAQRLLAEAGRNLKKLQQDQAAEQAKIVQEGNRLRAALQAAYDNHKTKTLAGEDLTNDQMKEDYETILRSAAGPAKEPARTPPGSRPGAG